MIRHYVLSAPLKQQLSVRTHTSITSMDETIKIKNLPQSHTQGRRETQTGSLIRTQKHQPRILFGSSIRASTRRTENPGNASLADAENGDGNRRRESRSRRAEEGETFEAGPKPDRSREAPFLFSLSKKQKSSKSTLGKAALSV